MVTETGIRFTEEQYATKDEVKKFYNISSIDGIWNQIMTYRMAYTHDTDLRNIESSPLSVVLSPKVNDRMVAFERKLMKINFKFEKLSCDGQQLIIKERLVNTLLGVSDSYSLGASKDLLMNIVDNNLGTIPSNLALIHRYALTSSYYQIHNLDPFDYRLLQNIYLKLSGEEVSLLDTKEKAYRTTDIDPMKEHYTLNKLYNAAPLEKISELVDKFTVFIAEHDLSPLVKFVATLFYVDYIKPFEYFNEELSPILAKIVLSRNDFEVAPFLLNLDVFFTKYKENTKIVFAEVQKTLDLTYALNYVLDILEKQLGEIFELLLNYEVNIIKEENFSSDEVSFTPLRDASGLPIPLKRVYDFSKEDEFTPLNFEKKVALPVLPRGLDEADASSIAKDLRELYPFLRRSQCEFYARHCTIGKHYSIQDFKEADKCAYETARTSMDDLADSGFYEKKKVRNKFVYSPINKN